MRASLGQIESFYWTARLGGISAAARHQNLTQPAVSTRIRELEANLGAKLLERSQGRLQLTAIGAAVLARVQLMLQLADEIDSQILRRQPMRGLLRMGTVESAALAGLVALLGRLGCDYPDLKTQVTVDEGSILTRKLAARQLDIIIAGQIAIGPHIDTHCLGAADIAWLAAARAPFPAGAISAADLRDAQILTISENSLLYKSIREFLPAHDLRSFHYCNSHPIILESVAAGQGIALMPVALANDYIERGLLRILDVSPAPQPQQFYVSYFSEGRGSDGVDKLVGLIEDCLQTVGFINRPARQRQVRTG